jgi:competence protein ComFC
MAHEYKQFADIVFLMHFYNRFLNLSRDALGRSLDTVLPRTCYLCEAIGSTLCHRCEALVRSTTYLRCSGCGLKTACDCNVLEWQIDRTFAMASYQAPIDSLIGEMKFQSKQSIGKVLGAVMGQEFALRLGDEKQSFDDFCLVPVPLSAARFRHRGFNQADTIAKALAKHLALPVRHIIARSHQQQSQSQLGRQARLSNLHNAYLLTKLPPRKVILVDDVMTTGTTLNHCAGILKSAGTAEVWAMVAARTEIASKRARQLNNITQVN